MLISKNFPCWEQSLACLKLCMALWPSAFCSAMPLAFLSGPFRSCLRVTTVSERTQRWQQPEWTLQSGQIYWQTSSPKGHDCRNGFRACEIITVLNLSSHGQLVTADTRLRVIRPYLSLSPQPCASLPSTGLSYPFSLNWRDEKWAGVVWNIMKSKDSFLWS